jgi:hypothetical protein
MERLQWTYRQAVSTVVQVVNLLNSCMTLFVGTVLDKSCTRWPEPRRFKYW